MRDLSKLTFHPTTEQIVELLCEKTQNSLPQFFRMMVCYYVCKMAATMRVHIKTKDRGDIPINFYGINLGISGIGWYYLAAYACECIRKNSLIAGISS